MLRRATSLPTSLSPADSRETKHDPMVQEQIETWISKWAEADRCEAGFVRAEMELDRARREVAMVRRIYAEQNK